MAKMTKAQARKRLSEARKKLIAIWDSEAWTYAMTTSDNREIVAMIGKLDTWLRSGKLK